MQQALAITAELCKRFEGFRSRPYLCPAGVPTIGYGATYYLDGRRVSVSDLPVTREQATELLMAQLTREYFPGVIRLCPILITHPARLAAIADFSFNLGLGRLQSSTLRRRVNEGNWEAAKAQLLRWNRAGGRVLPGLVRRREAEAALL
jgi:lysozyme